jgi:HSP20 family protein
MFELEKRGRFPFWHNSDPDGIFGNFFSQFEDVFGYQKFQDKDGNVVNEIEVPGFNKENLNVEVADGILTIKGERTTSNGEKREVFKRITIGPSEKVNADLKDGILILTLIQPKKSKVKVEIK